MKIELGGICRGDGNVYVRVLIEGDEQGCVYEARSVSVGGERLPARVLPCPGLPAPGLVAAVSILDIDQTLTVTARDASGAVYAQASRRVNPKLARIQSKVATLRKTPEVDLIRGFDAVRLPGEAFITLEMMTPDRDAEIVSGSVDLSIDNPANLTSAYDIVCLDRMGRRIDDGWVCMGDVSKAAPVPSGYASRRIAFSMRIPAGVREFTVWARPADPAAWPGFRSVEWFVANGLRDAWRYLAHVPVDADPDYEHWFMRVHRANEYALAAQRKHVFAKKPLFSIVVPLYKTPLDFFEDMAGSVLQQTYGMFELILVNASPEDEDLARAVDNLAKRDARVRVVKLAGNLGIAENTNEGIRAARGDFVCFLDHDDMLEPDALFEYARVLNEHEGIDLLYCDEDKLNDGHYSGVFLKPDFSPDLLLGLNYITHFLACRREVLLKTGFTPSELDGAQDYDATWRVAEQGGLVWHVRRVLYHWRVHPGSTAGNAGQKDYAQEAGRLVVQRHLDRCGIAATVRDHPKAIYSYEVDYNLSEQPLVSIVIPNKDGVDLLRRCLDSIRSKTSYENYEVIVVENNSCEEQTFSFYEEIQRQDDRMRVVVSPEKGFNFSRVCNAGAREARGERLLFLNNDTEVIEPRWMEYMLGHTMRPDVAAVGALLMFPDDTVQHAGVAYSCTVPAHICYRMPFEAYANMFMGMRPSNLSIVTGACLMVRRDAFDKVGGFDERFAVNYNDVDFCLRLRAAGYYVVYDPRVRLFHYESVSRGRATTDEELMSFQLERLHLDERWLGMLIVGDPFYSPLYNRNDRQLYYRF